MTAVAFFFDLAIDEPYRCCCPDCCKADPTRARLRTPLAGSVFRSEALRRCEGCGDPFSSIHPATLCRRCKPKGPTTMANDALCSNCKKKSEKPTKVCDTCGRKGCRHFIIARKADPTKDDCGGCRLKAMRASAAKKKEPPKKEGDADGPAPEAG